ncbi:hypothetical protein CBL_09262 [Carabus blaptoides fortunei]
MRMRHGRRACCSPLLLNPGRRLFDSSLVHPFYAAVHSRLRSIISLQLTTTKAHPFFYLPVPLNASRACRHAPPQTGQLPDAPPLPNSTPPSHHPTNLCNYTLPDTYIFRHTAADDRQCVRGPHCRVVKQANQITNCRCSKESSPAHLYVPSAHTPSPPMNTSV